MAAPRHAILGTSADGAPFWVDVGRLAGGHMALIANSGAGKTRSVRKLLEETHGQIQHIVLDDELDFYTLRERFGYVLVGGDNGDCPLTVESAEPLALTLLEHGLSAVIQTGAFADAEDGQRFVARFLEALLKAPRALSHPALIVLDEAQRFAPSDGTTAASKAVAEFAASARKRGFTLVAATGRFTSLSARVRAHVVNWLVGRAGLDLDSRAAAQALGFRPSSPEAREIPALTQGRLWAFGPALAERPTLVQFGAVATSHLAPGQAPVPTPPAPAKMRKILQALARAATAAVDAAPAPASPAADAPSRADAARIAEAERAGYERGLQEGLRRGAALVTAYARDVAAALDPVLAVSRRYAEEARSRRWALPAGSKQAVAPPAAAAPSPDSPQEPSPEGEAAVTPTRQRLLDAIAWAHAAGLPEPPREIVAVLAGVAARSSGYRNNLGALHTAGLIAYPRPGMLALSTEGRARARAPEAAPDHGAMMARVEAAIAPAQMRILAAAVAAYPEALSREALAARAGASATASGFRNNVGALASLGLVTYPAPGWVRAADILFPDGAASGGAGR